ncbi:MAG: 30S ribosomal protein S8 [Candidatus Saelkia tenebricola]|nr:30S ribosomal protein S8 [Candidatus Saelkia tenebricola]
MSVTDPLADAFVKIKNAYAVKKDNVDIKSSKILLNIVNILKREKFIQDYKSIEDNKQGLIRVYLKYSDRRKPALEKIKRISKSGCRVYVDKDNIPNVMQGIGMAILTTSKGVLSDVEARERNIGGEVICHIY